MQEKNSISQSPSKMISLQNLLQNDLRPHLPPSAILVDQDLINPYLQNTSGFSRNILAVIRPRTLQEVRACVATALKLDIKLYPTSTGCNWGYGSQLPVTDWNVIVDLSAMHTILEVNERLGFVVLEPGVTQQQLYSYLNEHNVKLLIDPSGAGPKASIVGNALDRGHGIGHYGDHFNAIAGLEVVLPTAEVLHTGMRRFGEGEETAVYKWGVGPYLDGLFSQGNFGIVTKAVVWLEPKPEQSLACYFSLNSASQLMTTFDALARLRSEGCIASFSVANRTRVLTTVQQYPWKLTKGTFPLPPAVEASLGKQHGISPWTGMLRISGSKGLVQAKHRTIKQTLGPHVSAIRFFSQRTLDRMHKLRSLCGTLFHYDPFPRFDRLADSFAVLHGKPVELTLRSAYWRNKTHSPARADLHPARDGCGVIWCAPIIPLTGKHIERFCALVEPIFQSFQLETCLAFLPVNDRACICSLPILFDPTCAIQQKQADDCYQVLSEMCNHNNFFPYRLTTKTMNKAIDSTSLYWKFVSRLKDAVDPRSLIAPRRYSPK